MKRFISVTMVLALMAAVMLTGCGKQAEEQKDVPNVVATDVAQPTSVPDTSAPTEAVQPTSVPDTPVPTKAEKPAETDKPVEETKQTKDDFRLMSEANSEIKGENGIYKITTAGEFSASGTLSEGQIVVDAKGAEVVIILNGTSISCSTGAPISIIDADTAKIKVSEGTVNYINDNRSARAKDDDTEEKGAVYATCDLDITGKGELNVVASFNNGIHTKDSLSIKNVTLNVEALKNALKGNDEVEIKSGTLKLVAKNGSGIKTENTEISKKGNQKGKVIILSGTVIIDSKKEAIAAAYSSEISEEAVVESSTR